MTQPHIGINLLHVHPALAGVRVYAAHFVESLAWSWPEAKITIFVGYGGLEALQATYDDIARLPNIEVETLDVDPRRKFALFYHENTTLAQRVRATGVDFLASLDYHQPLSIRPSAFVVHDLNYIDVGEGLPRSYRLLRKLVIPVCARRSSQIWTISPFTQARMAEHYPQFAAKTHMVGSGVPQDSPALTPLPDFDATTPYLLSVGTFNPNKNYDRLAAAFEKLDWDGKLVIVGKRGPASDNPLLQKMRERLGDRLEIHDAGGQRHGTCVALCQCGRVCLCIALRRVRPDPAGRYACGCPGCIIGPRKFTLCGGECGIILQPRRY